MDWALLIPVAMQLLPVFAPVLTAGVKRASESVGAKIPNQAKPLVNALLAVLIGGLVGADPTTSLIAGQVGKSVRDAHDNRPDKPLS